MEIEKYGEPGTFDDRLIVQGHDDDIGHTITFWINSNESTETATFGGLCDSKVLDLTTVITALQAPDITSWNPDEETVSNYEGATRAFNISVDQKVNVSWLINGTQVQFNNTGGVTEASYTNESAVIGYWNVSALVENVNGTDMHTWMWKVEAPSPCFIATAAYGTPLHEDIDVLRDFRDEYLMTNPPGRTFVKTYYTSSPPIADALRENEGLRTMVREGLIKPLVYISRVFL